MSNGHLDRVEALVARVLDEVGAEKAAPAIDNLRRWLRPDTPYLEVEDCLRAVEVLSVSELYDEFWRVLPFGTGGRRGHVGCGPNRINPTTVALTIQGHADFLRSEISEQIQVVVANDVRRFSDINGTYTEASPNPLIGLSSRSLALMACEIYAANGIVTFISEPESDEVVLTTPELSFAIHELSFHGGVMFSASHNHPDDNGVKVYDASGAQPIAPVDQRLTDVIDAVGEVSAMPLADAIAASLVRDLPAPVREAYLGLYGPKRIHPAPAGARPVVFTPLCGSGDSTAGEVLRRLGHTVLVPPDQLPDGSFAVIPYRSPNPEVSEATVPARRFADASGADIVFSSDPDADRLGVDLRQADGTWTHLTGNQIAGILAYYLMLDASGPQTRGLVLTTNVTTRLVTAIARQAGCEVIDDLLVGFKYIADVLRRLDIDGEYGSFKGRSEDLVLGAEESHGLLCTSQIRDKDAASGIAHLAALHQRLAARGEGTLFDYYLRVLDRMGYFAEANRSIMMLGESGIRNTEALMASLRGDPPEALAGRRLLAAVDYLDEKRFGVPAVETERSARNVLRLEYEGMSATVRPSGTEPKLKLYVHVLPDGAQADAAGDPRSLYAAAVDEAQLVARSLYEVLARRVGIELSAAALALPDVIVLGQKARFDRELGPWIKSALESQEADVKAVQQQLLDRAGSLVPGADPLPALRPAIETLAEGMGDSANPEILQRLVR